MHKKGEIHFHDLDYHPFQPLTNCCLIDAEKMLSEGFQIGNATVTSPKSIQTASAQLVQIIANVSSSQYGGCTIDRVDELLSHYVIFNEQKHRETAEKFVTKDNIDTYIDEQITRDIKVYSVLISYSKLSIASLMSRVICSSIYVSILSFVTNFSAVSRCFCSLKITYSTSDLKYTY